MQADTVDDDSETRKDAAFELIERGFHVLAVAKGEKRPDKLLAPNGFKDATRELETAAGWWTVKPQANLGIACGAEYGLVVLDVDTKNGAPGVATLAELVREGLIPPTLTADTPSGGCHLYFKHPARPLPATLPGIDIKGADGGGYVLAPPSTLETGAYTWRDAEMPVADFPPALLERLTGRTTKAATPAASGPAASLKVPQGKRHDRLVSLAAAWRARGLDVADIEALLWHHATHYFEPAFSPDNPEDVRELEDVLRWFGKKPDGAGQDGELVVATTAELFKAADEEPSATLLDPVLPEAGNLMIYGPTGAGKSHLATSIALALTESRPLLDWIPARPVPVLFCDGEMPLHELKDRLEQYLAGRPPPDSLFWCAARMQDGDMPNLADPAAQARYLAAVQATGARVVIFDNLSCLRSTDADLPENSSEAWQPVARFIRQLNRAGVAVVLVHHAAKSGSQRGSTAHVAVMDTVLKVAPPGEGQADPVAELDVDIQFEKHRRFGAEAAAAIRAKVIGDEDGFAAWQKVGTDPLVDQVVPMVKQGLSQVAIARALKRSRRGIQKAIGRAKAQGKLPLEAAA